MFGYIRPDSKELKVKEYELYKSTYCGLCRVMGKRYSFLYKMSLSYDFVFMVLLRLYCSDQTPYFSKRRCIAHPTKKKVMMNGNEALDTASDVGVIMLYHNFIDKINDKDGIKSLLCRLVLPELKRLRQKACKSSEMIAEFDKQVGDSLKELSDLEKQNCPSVDLPAEVFGKILGNALSIGYEGNQKRTVYEIGRNIGKWIYISDALDDIDKDESAKKFNPFLASFGNAEEAKKHGNAVSNSLLNQLNNAYNALILLDGSDKGIYNILDNIITIGNVNTQEEILKRKGFITQNSQKEELNKQ
ncbi:MAG: hypothetical protein IKU45_05165 [Clostridia bacterium]|nr:hypothetical protein [Clostridia bacterium]